MPLSESTRAAAVQELEKVLASDVFRSAGRSSRLFRFLVELTLDGQADRLKEYTIGADALGRGEKFDPRIDSIARVEVSRLRTRLDQYYATEGRADPLTIVLPKGGYVPRFERPPVETAPATRRNLPWIAAAAAALAGSVGLAVWALGHGPQPTSQPLVQVDIELNSEGRLGSVVGTHAVLSPDGSLIAFVAADVAGTSRLYTRRMSDPEISELPGTEGARGPFFSPDGQQVAFWARGKVWKAPVAGGSPVPLCDALDLLGGTWGDDGTILATLNSTNRIWRIPPEGGFPEAVQGVEPGSNTLSWAWLLPGSKAFLFTRVGPGGPDAASIEVFSMTDRTTKTLVRGGTFGRYLPSGHLVYVNRGVLFAVEFDPERLETRGAKVPLLRNIDYSPVFGFAQFDVSRSGTAIYRRSTATGQVTVQWIDESGRREPIISKPGRYLWPSLSRDGQRLAVTVMDSGTPRVSVIDSRGTLTPVSSAEGVQTGPLWTRDGRALIARGDRSLIWLRADGSVPKQNILRESQASVPWSFSPDGKRLAYYELNPATHFDVWTAPFEYRGEEAHFGTPEPFVQTKAVETYPAFSPDGRWLAYTSNESGSFSIYVRPFPGREPAVRISTNGRVVRWPARGNRLFFATDDQRLMTVAWEVKDGVFHSNPPRQWMEARLADTGVLANFDVSPDGRRVAALLPVSEPGQQQSANHVTLVMNLFDEVRRRTAADAQ